MKKKIDNCLFGTGSNGNKYINDTYKINIRNLGSAALDLAYVASGRYDGYFQNNLNLWDIAAGIIIIKEAGGIINDIDLGNIGNIKVLASSTEINTKFIEKIDNF